MGGTGANHIMFGYADAIWYSDGKGGALTPPTNEIENPDPQAGTNNYYDQDGYGGGSYSACADLSQPGVPAVVNYLQALPRPVKPNCEAGHYYLLNNYNPGFLGNGVPLPLSRFAVHDSADIGAPHRRCADGAQRLVRVLRRALEPLCCGFDRSGSGSEGDAEPVRRVLQHLQSVSVRHGHHDQRPSCARNTLRTPTICTRRSRRERFRRFRS